MYLLQKKFLIIFAIILLALLAGVGFMLKPKAVETVAPAEPSESEPASVLDNQGSSSPASVPEDQGTSSKDEQNVGSKDLEQDDTKTPEDIDQAIKDKETEIDQQIEDGTYTPPTPNPELTDPAEPPPAAGDSSGEQEDGGGENPVDPPPTDDPPPTQSGGGEQAPPGIDPDVWGMLNDLGITVQPGVEDGSGSDPVDW